MTTDQNAASFSVARGGVAPVPPPPEPHPNHPIDMTCGTFNPLSGCLEVLPPGNGGILCHVHTDQPIAREIEAAVGKRTREEVLQLDFGAARRRLVASGLRLCLAASRRIAGAVSLFERTGEGDERGVWIELATCDRKVAGLAVAIAEARMSKATPEAGIRRFYLWSVPKTRRRCGVVFSAASKECTIIDAAALPTEMIDDAQLLIFSSPIPTAAAEAA